MNFHADISVRTLLLAFKVYFREVNSSYILRSQKLRAQSKFDVLQSWFKCDYSSINESKTIKVLPLGDNPPHYDLNADSNRRRPWR